MLSLMRVRLLVAVIESLIIVFDCLLRNKNIM